MPTEAACCSVSSASCRDMNTFSIKQIFLFFIIIQLYYAIMASHRVRYTYAPDRAYVFNQQQREKIIGYFDICIFP